MAAVHCIVMMKESGVAMASYTSVNFDKLRHIVQKFGSRSFTTSQVAMDYQENDPAGAEALPFNEVLQRHATLLGIDCIASLSEHETVWQASSTTP